VACLAFLPDTSGSEPADSLTTEALVSHASQWLKSGAGGSDEAATALDAARQWLTVDTASLCIEDGTITWSCRAQRALAGDEQAAAVKSLEVLLLQILSSPAGPGRAALRRQDEARRLVDGSTLSIDRPPQSRTILSLTSDEVSTVIEDYVASLARQGKLQTRQFADANRVCEFRGPQARVDYYGGTVFWNVPPRDRRLRTFMPRNERDFENWMRQAREYISPALPALALLARTALATHPHPEYGQPLLTADQTLKVRIWLEPVSEIGVADAAPSGIHILRSAPSKGAADRTMARVTPATATLVTTSSTPHERVAFGLEQEDYVDDQPRLVLDPQGYSGAAINALAFSPNGRLLAAGGDVVRIWELPTGNLIHTLRGATKFGGVGGCTDLAFSPDGRQLLVAVHGFHLSLRVYDTGDFTEIEDALAGHDGHIDRLAISRDGQWVATAGIDQHVHVWDWKRYRKVRSYRFRHPIEHLSFPGTDPWFLAINVDGAGVYERTAANAPAPRTNVLGNLQSAFSRRWPDDGAPHPFALTLALDRQRYAAGGISRVASGHRYWCGVWSLEQAEPLQVHDHRYLVTACALSPDVQWAASADALGEIHVWSTATGEVRHRLTGLARANYSVAFDGTESRLLIGRQQYRRPDWQTNHYGPLTDCFDLLRRRFDSRRHQPPVPARLTQNERELDLEVEDRSKTIRVRRAGVIESTLPFRSSTQWWPLSFSFLQSEEPGFPDPIVIGSESGSLGCFEPSRLLLRRTFLGHTDRVWSVAESPSGRYLASGSGDGTLRVWSLSAFREWGNLAAYCDEAGEVYHVVPGTPTAQANVRPGDRIGSIDWQRPENLALALGDGDWPLKAGQVARVELDRNGQEIQKKIELSNMGDLVRPLLNLFVTRDGREWIVWTSGGYYDCSPRADRLLGWQVNREAHQSAHFHQLAQFQDRFHRPDVIDLVLETGKRRGGTSTRRRQARGNSRRCCAGAEFGILGCFAAAAGHHSAAAGRNGHGFGRDRHRGGNRGRGAAGSPGGADSGERPRVGGQADRTPVGPGCARSDRAGRA
jgi:WD40 repeat protein